MPRPQFPLFLVIGLFLAAVTGCQRKPKLEDLVTQGEQLSGVRSSKHSRLREEFRAIELAHGLPRDLNRPALDPADNAAAPLVDLFDGRELKDIEKECEAWMEDLQVDPLDSSMGERAARIVEPWQSQIARLEALSARRGCHLGIQYERGRFGDFRLIAFARGSAQLLLADSVRRQGKSLDEGIAQLAQGWKWTLWLMEERYLEAWLTAAELRLAALAVVERMANDPRATPADLERLAKMLSASFRSWPSVESALLRERAIDLHTYEAIRLGLVELLFSTKERGELRVEGVLDKLKSMKPERIDADEAAYLAYMRQAIELSRKPFYAAKDELVEADRMLGVHAGTDDYPWFAIRLCTENLTLAQAELASDRARVEAWVIALGEATGKPPAEVRLNPRSGKAYEVERDERQIRVRLGDRKLPDPLVDLPQQ